jgi:exopolysaccharide biosynthesis polyprenyl glycosylphosphotransferase
VFDGELRRQRALFAATDVAAVVSAVEAAGLLRDSFGVWNSQRPRQHAEVAATIIVIVAVWIVTARAVGLYHLSKSGLSESFAVIKASSTALLTFLILCFFAHQEPSRLAVGAAFLLSIGFAASLRIMMRQCIRHLYANPAVAIPIVIVGYNPFAGYVRDRIIEELSQYEFLGFIEESDPASGHKDNQLLGGLEQLPHLASAHRNLEAALILHDSARARTQEIIELCESLKVRWRVMPSQFRSLVRPLKVDMVGVVPLIGPRSSNIEGLNYIIKRCFDVLAAILLLVLTFPIALLAALALWIFDGRPLLFRQTRVGIYGKRFELLKFRTMRARSSDEVHREFVKGWIQEGGNGTNGKKGPEVFKLGADPRITRVGYWLRKFSIDELLQLLNVLRGEMSLIGPRPALPYETELYQDWHRHRLDALPGITGLWQVSGRNRVPFDQMVQLDIRYIEDWSFTGDLGILLRTLPALFQGGGF